MQHFLILKHPLVNYMLLDQAICTNSWRLGQHQNCWTNSIRGASSSETDIGTETLLQPDQNQQSFNLPIHPQKQVSKNHICKNKGDWWQRSNSRATRTRAKDPTYKSWYEAGTRYEDTLNQHNPSMWWKALWLTKASETTDCIAVTTWA